MLAEALCLYSALPSKIGQRTGYQIYWQRGYGTAPLSINPGCDSSSVFLSVPARFAQSRCGLSAEKTSHLPFHSTESHRQDTVLYPLSRCRSKYSTARTWSGFSTSKRTVQRPWSFFSFMVHHAPVTVQR